MIHNADDTQPVVSFGLVGLGGYARAICDLLLQFHSQPNSQTRLLGVYEPDLAPHGEILSRLKDCGVKILPSYQALLDEPIQAVWLPIPIHLHRPFTEQALKAGKKVVCEKPVAGTIDDVDALIAARDASGMDVAIGFQDIYDTRLIDLKRKLLDGVIGPIERFGVAGCWPRGTDYYARNAWAGRARVGENWILDSPVNNAMAHFVNLSAFLAGPTINASIRPTGIEAELYRVYDIENYDTASLRITTDGGQTLSVLMTHACREQTHPVITLQGRRGRCEIEIFKQYRLEADGQTTTVDLTEHCRLDMVRKLTQWVMGEPTDGPVATLETARVHTLIVNGASDAAPVVSLSASQFETFDIQHGKQRAIPGINQAMLTCAAEGKMLHESCQFPWTRPAATCDLRNYNHFQGDRFIA